jgi:muramidase (phage lysozyme)
MAATAEIISQTSSINSISKTISSTRSTLVSTNSTVGRIQKIIETKTKVRTDLFFKNQTSERRRREVSKRREYEDQIEASKVTTNFQSGLRVASSSNQGPLGRILSFLGYMGAGWIVENIPTWIGMGKEFIARMKKAGEIIYTIPLTMLKILQGFGQSLGIIGRDISNLDFTDSSGDIRNSFAELTYTIELLGTQITDGFKLMLQPSGEVDVPSTGEQQPDNYTDVPPVSAPSSGGGGGVGTKEQRAMLDAIAFAEGTKGQPDNGYKTLFGFGQFEDYSKHPDKVVRSGGYASAAAGRYQFMPGTFADQAKKLGLKDFSPRSQDLAAINLAKEYGVTQELLQKEGMSMRVSSLLGRQWASFPGKTIGLDQPTKKLKNIQEVYQKTLGSSQQPPKSQTQTPSAPPRPVSTGTMNLIPQSGSGGFIQGGSGSGGDATYATHFHIDTKNANPNAAQLANIREVSFQAVKAMFARGSWIHFGNIKKNVYSNISDSELRSLIAAEQRAHDVRSSASVDIQEHNPKTKQTFPSQPGSATKFPFAVGEVYYRGGYGREAEIIGTGGITVSHGAAGSKASGVSATVQPSIFAVPQESNITPSSLETKYEQPEIASLTPEQLKMVANAVEISKRGQEIVVIDDRSPAQTSVSIGSQKSYGGGVSGQITEFDLLNKFMKQKLLLDFNYL